MRPWIVALAAVAADQASKYAVAAAFEPAQSVGVLPPVLFLTYVRNTGMAFGLFRGYPYVFVALAVLIAAWIVLELRRGRGPWWTETALGLILGGAVGNVIDRVRLGYVIDFIDLRVWPVFNLADSAITIGVTILLWTSLFHSRSTVR